MYLAKVIGTVVSTSKDPGLVGFKLLVTQRLDVDDHDAGLPEVAVDTVGAGNGETVIIVKGSSARNALQGRDCPVDATIVGIVDTVEIDRS
ncbi:EutN/CcmL family microcompartment protein [Aestuariimicrobium sp. p3-SID1156]|uniref:EutN/CcmL family microcompartment protein n=1 Tax=Aestuariimicrobium sp. p3-SID1156 TaxID=2916038 RepID=UPI00223B4ECA|nr:EutN/CcmL family microcompartment protein [Aestuariimicrobium sp. p3-SID1156]MCT1458349.1 EutN/CcmL family microcompartment protein [Aestuariimicrobium sp. p3-SID1156]